MSEFFVWKLNSILYPCHGSDADEIQKLPKKQPMRCKITRVRNVDHHRKYFALLNHAFDVWEPQEPPECYEGPMPMKSFERFRKDLTILAGFYNVVWKYDGKPRLEAKSISFSSMDQDEFEDLYDKTVQVIVEHVLESYTGDELKRDVDQILEFD